MWIRKNSLEAQLAQAMGYEYCTLFDTARSAVKALLKESKARNYLPSNVCPALLDAFERKEIKLLPVSCETGLSAAPVQLYGYRQDFKFSYLELDPLMTGFLRKPCAANCVISFGPKKMLEAGGGGALLSEKRFEGKAYFPEALRDKIIDKLAVLVWRIEYRRELIDKWDAYLGDSCIRIPQEQIMPWRVMRRIPDKRDEVVKAIRSAGYPVGTNYPPLPGIIDPRAIQWGKEVINFFPDSDAQAISEIVKRAIRA